jgi:hypothetical protein
MGFDTNPADEFQPSDPGEYAEWEADQLKNPPAKRPLKSPKVISNLEELGKPDSPDEVFDSTPSFDELMEKSRELDHAYALLAQMRFTIMEAKTGKYRYILLDNLSEPRTVAQFKNKTVAEVCLAALRAHYEEKKWEAGL